MSKYYIITKRKDYFPFDGWMTKLEMSAFGWKYEGHGVEYFNEYNLDIDWEAGKGTITQKSRVFTVFKRIRPYTHNIFFIILEFLMSIQSWIRRKLIFLLWFLTLFALVVSVIYWVTTGIAIEMLGISIGIIAFTYMPSLFYAILGFLMRKIFFIDKKLEKNLVKNGYSINQNI